MSQMEEAALDTIELVTDATLKDDANFRQRNRSRAEADLDMTPLIDVVFLLLIFFLVTAAYATQDQTVICRAASRHQRRGRGGGRARERRAPARRTVRILYEGEEELVDATPEALREALKGRPRALA